MKITAQVFITNRTFQPNYSTSVTFALITLGCRCCTVFLNIHFIIIDFTLSSFTTTNLPSSLGASPHWNIFPFQRQQYKFLKLSTTPCSPESDTIQFSKRMLMMSRKHHEQEIRPWKCFYDIVQIERISNFVSYECISLSATHRPFQCLQCKFCIFIV